MRILRRKKKSAKSTCGNRRVSAPEGTSFLRYGPSWLALEPRIMFDGAGVATLTTVVTNPAAEPPSAPDDATTENAPSDAAPTGEPQFNAGDQALFDALAANDAAKARQEIVFVSPSVRDYQQLLDGISLNVEVHVLDPTRDGVQQMADVLAGRTGVDAVHLIAEGNEAQLHLGSSFLTQESISTTYAQQLQQIGQSLSADADLMIYGCNFGQGDAGQLAIQTLAGLTGADVAASTDYTGHVDQTGNWILEATTGAIESSVVIGSSAQSTWDHALTITSPGVQPSQIAVTSTDRTEVIFVDSTVAGYEILMNDLLARNTESTQVQIVVLDQKTDGLQAITSVLSGYQHGTIDAVHIVSHGVEGALQVGSTWINQFSLDWQADLIASWSPALTDSADIMLWGCNVAATSDGQAFINRLAQLTGADVAASIDDTGHSSVGGDWNLEYATAQIETSEFNDSEFSDWVDVLAITANGAATSAQATGVTSLTWSHTVASGANRALFVTLAIDGLGAGVSSVTYDGVALTQVGRTAGNHAVEIWRLVNPNVGTANVVVSLGATTDIKGGAVTYDGVDQTAPTGTYASANGTGTTATVNVSSATGELVLDITNWDNNPSGYTTGAGQTAVWNLTNIGHRGVSTTEAGATTVTMSSTVSASNQWETGAVSIKASASSPPVNTVPGAQSTNEDINRVFSSGNGNQVSISDSDAGSNPIEVTVSVTNGALTLNGTTGLTFTTGDGTTDATMTFRGTITNINTALNGLSYTPTSNYNGGATLTIATKDSTLVSLDIDANLQARYTFEGNANDVAPGTAQNGTLTNGASIVTDGTRGQVLSLDGVNDHVQISGLWGSPTDITLAAWVNLTSHGSGGGEVITLGNSAILRVDDASQYLVGFVYDGSTWQEVRTSAVVAGTGWRHVAFSFSDGGNLGTLYLDGAVIATAAITASINYTLSLNSFIGIHGDGNTTFNFGGTIDDALVYNRALNAAEIATLASDLSLTDTDTVAITVTAVNDSPTVGGGFVPAVDEDTTNPPGATISSIIGGTFSDPDAGASFTGVLITFNPENITQGVWQYSTDGGATWFNVGTIVSTNTALALSAGTSVRFLPAADYNGSPDILSFRGLDNTYAGGFTSGATRVTADASSPGGSSPISSSLVSFGTTINAVNDPPIITSNGGGTTASVSVAENTTAVTTVTSTDVDGGTPVYSIVPVGSGGGADAAQFSINASTGALTFVTAPDFETPTDVGGNNVYDVTVQVSDGNGGTDTQTLAVTVTNQAITSVSATGSATALGGGVYTLNLGANENATSWTINWGDGTVETVAGDPGSVTHTYAAGNAGLTFNILASATDAAGTHFVNDVIAPTAFLTGEGLYRYDAGSGTFEQYFSGAELSNPYAVTVGPDGLIYVAGHTSDNIVRYNATTGAFVDTFVAAGSGGLNAAAGLTFGPDGHLYVSNQIGDSILKYDGTTGAFISAFVSTGSGGLNGPVALVFRPDGYLYVGSYNSDSILRYNATTGAFVDTFVAAGSGGLNGPAAMAWGPDGNLYVASNDATVKRYNGTTGAFIGNFVTAGSGGLGEAIGLSFGPDGNLYVASYSTDKIIRYDGTTGALIGDYVTAGSGGLDGPTSFTFLPNQQVKVVSINASPTLDASKSPALTTQNEDAGAPVGAVGTLVSSLVDFSSPVGQVDNVTDSDGGSLLGVAITAADTTNGSWFYSTDNGANWNALGSVTNTSARLLAADGNTRIYFQSNDDYNGSISSALTFRAWDRTTGSNSGIADTSTNGGTTAFSTATDTVSLTVNPVNDAPVLADTVLNLTVAEDAGAPSGVVGLALSAFTGGITEPDGGSTKGIAITGTNETNGTWYYTTNGGTTWTAVGSVSNTSALLLADNANTRLYFAPNADYNGTSTGALTLRAWDQTSGTAGTKTSTASNGGTTAFSSATDTIDVNVIAANDAPTFSVGDGQAMTSFGSGWEFGKETLIQPDGKILVGGYSDSGGTDDFYLARYNADGTLDTSFGGGDGVAFAGIVGRAETMVLQADGKVVLSGYTTSGGYQVCLVRFNADGTLDTSFGGGDGIASSGVSGSAKDVALQADGKFLVTADLSNSNFTLMRFNSDGSLDTSFGGGSGYVSTDLAGSTDRADSLTIQSDGKVLLSGVGFNGTSFDFALVRYNTDGSLDTSFNGTGKVLTDFGGNSSDTGNEVRVQADGKIVVAGWSDTGGTNDFAIARYNANGTLDTGFGTGGKVTINLGGSDLAEGLTIQSDGKILVTGTAGINGGDVGLVRLNTDGTLDTTFGGGDGIVTTDYSGASDDRGYSVAVQNDGRIVVSGTTQVGVGGYNVSLNRYSSAGSLDTTLDPVNTLNGTPTYTEGGSPVVLDADVQIFDAELSVLNNFSGATLTLVRNGGANVEDVFSATGTLSLSGGNVIVGGTTIGTYTNSGGTLAMTFNSNATNTFVNQAMQQIAYSNSSDAPPASVQVNWTFNDGNTGSQGTGGALQATGSTTVTITATNDAPTITNLSGDGLAYNEGDGAVVIEQGGNALVADVDSTNFDTGTLTVSFAAGSDSAEDVLSIRNQGTSAGQIGVSGSNITYSGTVIGTYTGGSGGSNLVITFNSNATPTAVTALVQNITYQNTDTGAPTTGARTVRYVLTDGDGGTSANYDTTVTVSAVNDAPSYGGVDSVITIANPSFESTVLTDGNQTATLTGWMSSGAINGVWNPSAGAYPGEAPDGQNVAFIDSSGTIRQTLSATFQPGTGYRLTVAVGDFPGFDDADGWAIRLYAGNQLLGQLTNADFNVADGQFQDVSLVLDATTLSAYAAYYGQALTIELYDDGSSDNAHFDHVRLVTQGATATFVEDGAPVVIAPEASIIDPELTAANNFNETTLTLARNGGANSEDLFSATGTLASISAASGNVIVSGTTIGTYTNSGGQLVFTFNSSATNALVNSAMQQIAYANSSDAPPASVQIDWTVNDGNTGAQGSGGALSATGSTTVTITALNDPPAVTSNGGGATASVSIEENTTAVTTVTSSDVDGGTAVYSIVPVGSGGAADAAQFSINASTGALIFVTAPDFETPTDVGGNNVYDVTVQVSDGNGGTDTQVVSVTVTNAQNIAVVTTTADNNDSGVVAGNAAHTIEWLDANKGTDGLVSLREAMIAADNTAGADTIQFNIAGAGPHTINILSSLPGIDDTVTIDGTSEPDFSGTPIIELNGASAGAGVSGLFLDTTADNSVIRGLVINRFTGAGIVVGADNVTIAGNYIGTDVTGTVDQGNGTDGILLASGANGAIIGGATAADRNVVSGNNARGIAVSGSGTGGGHLIQGNYVGTNAAGTADLGNAGHGIDLNNSFGNTIRGNLVSGNDSVGVIIYDEASDNNLVVGNRIGTDVTGTLAIGNSTDGIVIGAGADNNLIGGSAPTDRNIISGNVDDGIEIGDTGTTGNTVSGNYIGTDLTGMVALGNGRYGIVLYDGVSNTTIGGSAVGAGNLISRNANAGIQIDANANPTTIGNVIQGNRIGLDAAGNALLGNLNDGIRLFNGVTGTTIGGMNAGEGNIIAGNTSDGIEISSANSTGNAILGNSIYDNSQQGIDLGASGVTANDAGDSDTGANSLMNFPIIYSVVVSGGFVTVSGEARPGATVEFFEAALDSSGYGEGQTFLYRDTVSGSTAGHVDATARQFSITFAAGSVVAGDRITMTATDAVNNTSEFSASILAFAAAPTSLVVDTISDVADGDTTSISTLLSNLGADGFISLREAIFATNNTAGLNTITFNIAGAGAHTINPSSFLPVITDAVVIDGYSQSGASANTLTTGNDAVLLIELNGTGTPSSHGLELGAGSDGSTIRGLAINRWSNNGIFISSNNNVIEGNFIGADTGGAIDLGNTVSGLHITGANNMIGGTTAAARNLISGNDQYGVRLEGAGAMNNIIAGNYIGLDADGMLIISNGRDGVYITNGASNNIVGGTTTAHRNVITGNADDGVQLGGASGTIVQNNYIGTDATGTIGLSNADDGIDIDSGSLNNQILDNLISRNQDDGIDLGDTGANPGTIIRGNMIGLQSDGTTALGNGSHGILIGNGGTADNTIIGGATVGQGNTIAYNGGDGIYVVTSTGVSILGNAIYSNVGLGIDLGIDGVLPNDGVLTGGQPNLLIDFPVFTSVNLLGGNLVISGYVGTAPGDADFANVRVEIFRSTNEGTHGEGQVFLGFLTTDATGNFSGSVAAGSTTTADVITATATDISGNTSEYGPNTNVNVAPVITSNGGGTTAAVSVAENTTAVTTVTATDVDGDTPTYSIVPVGSGGAVDATRFTIDGNTGVLAFVTAPDFESPTDADSNNIYEVTVQVSDGNGGTDTQVISVTITNLNDNAPAIGDATVAVDENSANGTAVTNVNDSFTGTDLDRDGQAITYSITAGNTGGAFAIDANTGALTVATSAALDFETTPSVTLTVQASDGTLTDTAALTINLNNLNEPPIAGDDAAVTIENTAVTTGNVLANDSDVDSVLSPASITAFDAVSANGGTVVNNGDGTFTYTPAGAFNGTDTFTYTVFDGFLSDTATVTITVTPSGNSAPSLAANTGSTVIQGLTDVITVGELQVIDLDNSSTELLYTVTAAPTNGQLELTTAPGIAITTFTQADIDTGRVVFVHSGAAATSDSFTFTVSDGAGGTIGATTFAFTVSPFIPPPGGGGGSGGGGGGGSTGGSGGTGSGPTPGSGSGPAPDPGVGSSGETVVPLPAQPPSASTGMAVPSRETAGVGVGNNPLPKNFITTRTTGRIDQPSLISIQALPPLLREPLSISAQKALVVGHKLVERLTRLADDLERGVQERQAQSHLVGRVASFSGMALSAGFVAWILRGGSLVASFLVSMPAWRHFDPLPVLGGEMLTRRKRDRKMREDDEQEKKQFRGLDRVLKSSNEQDGKNRRL